LRPTKFNGGDDDFWEVKSIVLSNMEETSLFQSQDEYGFIENRDREYSKTPIEIKGFYDVFERGSLLTKFGFAMTDESYYGYVNFNDVVNRLGRPLVIGDIIELPSEIQYDPNMRPVRKFFEVTDLYWAPDGYAPGWDPTIMRVVFEPLIAKPEVQDVIGDMTIDEDGILNPDQSKYSEIAQASDRMIQRAKVDVPQRGSDTADIHVPIDEEREKLKQAGIIPENMSPNPFSLYMEDGLPPNGIEYTEGPTFPENPKDGEFHRIVYQGLAAGIAPRLYRYSEKLKRWIFVESDKRHQYNEQSPNKQQLITSKNSIPMRNVGKKGENNNG
jgi:hypothetical protein